jgi:hypothetical protein
MDSRGFDPGAVRQPRSGPAFAVVVRCVGVGCGNTERILTTRTFLGTWSNRTYLCDDCAPRNAQASPIAVELVGAA